MIQRLHQFPINELTGFQEKATNAVKLSKEMAKESRRVRRETGWEGVSAKRKKDVPSFTVCVEAKLSAVEATSGRKSQVIFIPSLLLMIN